MRTVLGQANVDLPKGTLNSPRQTYTLNTDDQLLKPEQYDNLVIAYRNGAPVRIRDVGHAISAAENDLIAGWTGLALLLHELATNAVKCGSMSSAEGRVWIESSLANGNF